jgi:uncharacterized membrane protein YphA (DoxX/SURF4 family)
MSSRGWVRLFARLMLGLIFFMAGWHKVFVMTPAVHASTFFTGPYADTWIPQALLWLTGVSIPILELVAGGLLLMGWRVREALLVLGAILLLVTYGHLLKEPLFSITGHIFPRSVLLAAIFLLPEKEDRLSLDTWLAGRKG